MPPNSIGKTTKLTVKNQFYSKFYLVHHIALGEKERLWVWEGFSFVLIENREVWISLDIDNWIHLYWKLSLSVHTR